EKIPEEIKNLVEERMRKVLDERIALILEGFTVLLEQTASAIESRLKAAMERQSTERLPSLLQNEWNSIKYEIMKDFKQTLLSLEKNILDTLPGASKIEELREAEYALGASLRSEIRNLADTVTPILLEVVGSTKEETLTERIEKGIENLRAFVTGQTEEFLRINSTAREENRRHLLEELEVMMRDNLRSQIESLLSSRIAQIGEEISGILDRLPLRESGRRGLFAPRPEPKEKIEKTPEKQRVAGQIDTKTDKRLAYLIGRTLGKDLIDKDGSLIAPKGDTVTENMLVQMREERRVLDLINCIDFEQ
ncbi:MAG: hypothetical protein AB1546_07885, partial [bacterium]